MMFRFSIMMLLVITPAVTFPYVTKSSDWYFSSSIKSTFLVYQSAAVKRDLRKIGLDFSADLLERGGFNLGCSLTELNTTIDPPVLYETGIDGSIWRSFFMQWIPGAMTWDVSLYYNRSQYQVPETQTGQGQGKNQSGNTTTQSVIGQGWTISSTLSFLNYKSTFYLDSGLAYTHYSSSDTSYDYTTYQLTPTMGVGMFNGKVWIQVKGYLSNYSLDNDFDPVGWEAKWNYRLKPRRWLPNKLSLRVFKGNQQHPVDTDAGLVYTSSDNRNSAYSVGLIWKHKYTWYVEGGFEEYTNLDSDDQYSGSYLHLSLSRQW